MRKHVENTEKTAMPTLKDFNENSVPAKIVVIILGFILIVGLFIYKAHQQPVLGIDYKTRRENERKDKERQKKEMFEFLVEMEEEELEYLQLQLEEIENERKQYD